MTTATKPDISQGINQAGWEELEKYYIHAIDQIHIPQDPKPHDIMQLNAKLERLYHEARLDFFYVNRSLERADVAYRKLKRAMYPSVKAGKNNEEREHLYQGLFSQMTLDKLDANTLSILGFPPLPKTIYEIREPYKDRVDFIKTVLDMIQDKTSRLITDSGAMKIEAQVAGRS